MITLFITFNVQLYKMIKLQDCNVIIRLCLIIQHGDQLLQISAIFALDEVEKFNYLHIVRI